MKIFLTIVIAFLAALFIGHYIVQDPGYWLMAYGHWSIEMPLWLGILGIILAASFISLLFSFIRKTFSLPETFKFWLKKRRKKQAQYSFQEGLIKFGEGKWQAAEQDYIASAKDAEIPFVHYVCAAYAAQKQENDVQRDYYLQLAYKVLPKSELPIKLIQAQFQIEHLQYEQALANLKHLQEIQPKHKQVLLLLKELYIKLEDWQALAGLLPALKRQKVESIEKLDKLEEKINLELLHLYVAKDFSSLQKFWQNLAKHFKSNPSFILIYAKACMAVNMIDNLIGLIQLGLKQEHCPEDLFHLYVNFKVISQAEKMRFLSELAKLKPTDAKVWFASGYVCLEERLLGQAKYHFEQALQFEKSAKHLSALAFVYELQGQEKIALSYYHQAYLLSSPLAPMWKEAHEISIS